MRRSVAQLVVGVVLGLGLALVASGTLRPLLYRVDHRDAQVFAGVVVLLTAVSLMASLVPARRVARIDPVRALAAE
jgi:ABC-type lipoprotein release transport system permease subunit